MEGNPAIPEWKPAKIPKMIQNIPADAKIGAFNRAQVTGVLGDKKFPANENVECEQDQR